MVKPSDRIYKYVECQKLKNGEQKYIEAEEMVRGIENKVNL